MTNRKFSLQNFKGGRALSREEMKNVTGGKLAPDLGTCTETCTSGNHTASCSSASGDCSSKQNSIGITISISCDGKPYDCGSSMN